MTKRNFASLDDVRIEKDKSRRQISQEVATLKEDVADGIIAPENFFMRSSNRFMNYVGYAMSAYKALKKAQGLMGSFFKKR